MKKFYCNGAQGFCDCPIICADCGFADGLGGEYRDIQVPDTQYEPHEIFPIPEPPEEG